MKNFRLGQAGAQILSAGKQLSYKPALLRIAGIIKCLAISGLCSMAVIFGGYAPFGVAIVAASGSGTTGLLALLGSTIGYIALWDTLDSLKYVAISVLVFAGLFVFKGLPLSKKQFFMPLTVLISASFVGIVFVAGNGFRPAEVLLFVTELILMSGGAYIFQAALYPDTQRQEDGEQHPYANLAGTIGTLVLTAVSLLALTPLRILGAVLPARAAAVTLTLWNSSKESENKHSGWGSGSVMGVTMGIAMDLALGRPFFSMTYAVSGLVSGFFSKAGRVWVAGAFVVVSAVCALWAGDNTLRFAMLAETFIGSVIFVILPGAETAQKEEKKAVTTAKSVVNHRHEDKLRQYTQGRLTSSGIAFGELYETLEGIFTGFQAKKDEDMPGVFDRASSKVCRKCALAGVCWDRDVTGTYNALSDASRSIKQNNTATLDDFPGYFVSRCLQINNFIKAVNNELNIVTYRRQCRARLYESRKQVCDQYAEMSRLLYGIADEITNELVFDTEAEKKLSRALSSYGTSFAVSVYRVSGARRRVDIEGTDLGALLADKEAVMVAMRKVLGYGLCEPEQQRGTSGDKLSFREEETLSAAIGVAAHRKHGQAVSGDSGTYFNTPDGKLYILLSDGMGSGKAAALESGLAVRLLERFLRAGISPETALATMNSALILRGEDNAGFVTIDLLVVDLLTGKTSLYKYGAAPSYLKRDGKVARIRCKALPAGLGLSDDTNIDVTRFSLCSGDTLLLASDGISDTTDDNWLQALLISLSGLTPKQQAAKILEQSAAINGQGDDMTAIVVNIA